jgi:hypothetical protein
MSNQFSDYELCDLYYTARLEFSRRFGIGAKTESHAAGLRAVVDHVTAIATPVFDEEAVITAILDLQPLRVTCNDGTRLWAMYGDSETARDDIKAALAKGFAK